MPDMDDLDYNAFSRLSLRDPAFVGLPLTKFPFDILDLIAEYLPHQDLANLCRVSRYFNECFRPVLYRNMRFNWPNSKKKRYDGQALLDSDFDKYLTSLKLELWCRAGANASYPIAMRKKQRSKLLRRLKASPSLSSLCLVQIYPPQEIRYSYHLQRWFAPMVSGFKNLKSLILRGRDFDDAPTIANLILASPGLKTLDITGLCNAFGFLDTRQKESIKNFWVRLLSIIRDRPFSDDAARVQRAGEPFLRLVKLCVDEVFDADFSILTDLSALRILYLHYPTYEDTESKDPEPWLPWSFDRAVNLRVLRVQSFTMRTARMVRHLSTVRPGQLKVIAVRNSRYGDTLRDIPIIDWSSIDITGYGSLGSDGSGDFGLERFASTVEHFGYNVKGSQRCDPELTIKDCIHLKSFALFPYGSVYAPLDFRTLATNAIKIFLAHEAAMAVKGRPSKLIEITSLKCRFWRETRSSEYVFFKTWDPQLGVSPKHFVEFLPKYWKQDAASATWWLGCQSRKYSHFHCNQRSTATYW